MPWGWGFAELGKEGCPVIVSGRERGVRETKEFRLQRCRYLGRWYGYTKDVAWALRKRATIVTVLQQLFTKIQGPCSAATPAVCCTSLSLSHANAP